MKFRILLVCGLLMTSGPTLAQDQAQQNLRQQQQQEQNWQWHQMEQEAAQEQEMPTRTPQPTGEWIKTWGAIAVGKQNGDTGVAIGKLTKEQAEKEAVHQCLSWGGGGCKPALVYHNQCAAIASLDGKNTISKSASASSPELAKEVALRACGEINGGAICKIVYSACSDPIFKRY